MSSLQEKVKEALGLILRESISLPESVQMHINQVDAHNDTVMFDVRIAFPGFNGGANPDRVGQVITGKVDLEKVLIIDKKGEPDVVRKKRRGRKAVKETTNRGAVPAPLLSDPGLDDLDIPETVGDFKKKHRGNRSGFNNEAEKRIDRFDVKRTYGIDDEDVRIMKIHLNGWKSAGKLSADQKSELGHLSGAWASKMGEEDRKKLLKLFNDLRKKLGIII